MRLEGAIRCVVVLGGGYLVLLSLMALQGNFWGGNGLMQGLESLVLREVGQEENLARNFVISVKGNSLEDFHGDQFSVYQCKKNLHKVRGDLPKVLVIGVHKGGSTALFGCLVQHGHLRPAVCKETGFFADDELFDRGLKFYRRHFEKNDGLQHIMNIEGTPSYIRNPFATARIWKLLPAVRSIVSLRDPVERFISNFVGFRERGLTSLSCNEFFEFYLTEIYDCESNYDPDRHFEIATEKNGMNSWQMLLHALGEVKPKDFPEPRDAASGLLLRSEEDHGGLFGKLSCDPGDQRCIRRECLTWHFDNPISRSIYVDQLVRWLRFFPPEQTYVVQAERFYRDKVSTLQRIANFIGLRPFSEEEIEAFETVFQGSHHSRSQLHDSCDKKYLQNFFRPENDLLMRLLVAKFPSVASLWHSWF